MYINDTPLVETRAAAMHVAYLYCQQMGRNKKRLDGLIHPTGLLLKLKQNRLFKNYFAH